MTVSSIITTILTSILIFLVLALVLVGVLLYVKIKLSPSGKITIKINGEKDIIVDGGDTLLSTLSNEGIFLPSACGGGGTCIQCTCQVHSGGGGILPTETPHFSRKEISDNFRLGCQVKVRENMEIQIPEEVFGVKQWEATVVSNYNVATYIKECILELPSEMDYKAGGYIQINIPESEISFADMDISAHPQDHPGESGKYEKDWSEGDREIRSLIMKNDDEVVRAYSMASYPGEGKKIMLNVRIATPPWNHNKNTWTDINPGIASSYIFNLKDGEKVTISGPYGEFFINDSDAEMLYIGGGAGMAPMRSHLYELFKTIKTGRKVTFFYGGRSKAELFYIHYFRDLEKEFSNFKFYLVLSDELKEDNWIEKKDLNDLNGDGFIGFVHQVVIDQFLKHHESPEDLELYFCGPPLMNQAVLNMADDWGIPEENVRFDDFGV